MEAIAQLGTTEAIEVATATLALAVAVVSVVCCLAPRLGFGSLLGRENVSKALTRRENAAAAGSELRDKKRAIRFKWQALRVAEREQASPDCVHLTLAFDDPEAEAGLPAGRHIQVRATCEGGQQVVRPYTPVSLPSQRGHLELLVKVYSAGYMSSHLASLKVGDSVEVRGPIGNCKWKANEHERVLCIGAGSGLTPLLQLMRCSLADEEDSTGFDLIYQNRAEQDILLRDVLEDLAEEHGDDGRVKIRFFLSRETVQAAAASGRDTDLRRRRGGGSGAGAGGRAQWHDPDAVPARHAGYVDAETLREALEGAGRVFICGPEGFNKFVLSLLHDAGVEDEMIKVF